MTTDDSVMCIFYLRVLTRLKYDLLVVVFFSFRTMRIAEKVDVQVFHFRLKVQRQKKKGADILLIVSFFKMYYYCTKNK